MCIEKPLELTNKTTALYPKYKCPSPGIKFPIGCASSQQMLRADLNSPPNSLIDAKRSFNSSCGDSGGDISRQPTTPTTSMSNTSSATADEMAPTADLVLPPPPPMWYPPLYPPYGIDPLHFFIDLRVSGHIYDRKKENISPPLGENNNVVIAVPSPPSSDLLESAAILKHQRHGSAFSVPPPRRDKSPSSALNLTAANDGKNGSGPFGGRPRIYESLSSISPPPARRSSTSSPTPKPLTHQDCLLNTKNTNYVLQNLPRIYTHLSSTVQNVDEDLQIEDTDSKSDIATTDDNKDDDHRGGGDGSDDDSNDVVIVDSKGSKNY